MIHPATQSMAMMIIVVRVTDDFEGDFKGDLED
jgi:hypothetical protein